MNRLGVLGIVFVDPAERVEGAVVGGRIALEALLQQAGDRALAAADRAVQQQHAAFDAVAGRRALERVDQMVQRPVEAEDGVVAVVVRDRRRSDSGRASRDRSRSRPTPYDKIMS